jgi:hypothetical protein
MKLHREVTHAGTFARIGPADSPARRGWLECPINKQHTPEDAKYHRTKPN